MIEIKAADKARGKTRWRSVDAAKRRVDPAAVYFIRRHGMWWRPNAQGYTNEIFEAGTYRGTDARGYLDVEGLSLVPANSVRDELWTELKLLEQRCEQCRRKLEDLPQ